MRRLLYSRSMTSATRPSFGVIFLPTFPPETLADYARRAEAAGFDELWLWDDCFLPGALTSTAIALSATQRLKVGIGLIPATTINPLFASMEFTTLARAFPGRFMPGYGHGVSVWMTQIGAAPTSSLKALEETVTAVRRLLTGEDVVMQGTEVRLDHVQMTVTPKEAPRLYVGAMRAKSLQLAGRVGDGTILTATSSPAYVKWAVRHVNAGKAAAGRDAHRVVTYVETKVSEDATAARAAARRSLATWWPWADVHMEALGITAAAEALVANHGERWPEHIPDAWLDELTAAGTPDQAMTLIERLVEAGSDSVILQPLRNDASCLDEYAQLLMPHIKARWPG